MQIGYRIRSKGDIDCCNLSLAQLSLWKNGPMSLNILKEISQRCRDEGIRYVIHPINFFISETRTAVRRETLAILKEIASMTDLGLIMHDETLRDGGRLCDEWDSAFKEGMKEITSICPVSVENANNSLDAIWFWRNFAPSITLDIGHLESAGIDSVETVNRLPEDIVEKIEYVHIHHNNGEHYGITDYWPLIDGCREIMTLSALLKRKQDIKVILEIDGQDGLNQSLKVLEKLT